MRVHCAQTVRGGVGRPWRAGPVGKIVHMVMKSAVATARQGAGALQRTSVRLVIHHISAPSVLSEIHLMTWQASFTAARCTDNQPWLRAILLYSAQTDSCNEEPSPAGCDGRPLWRGGRRRTCWSSTRCPCWTLTCWWGLRPPLNPEPYTLNPKPGADALPATLHGHFTSSIYRRPIHLTTWKASFTAARCTNNQQWLRAEHCIRLRTM